MLFTPRPGAVPHRAAGAEANLGTVRNQLVTLQATYRQKQAQIEQAKTDVAFYETGFQRQQDLLKRGVASQAAFDQAKRDLDAARERVTDGAARRRSDAWRSSAATPTRRSSRMPSYLAAQAQVDKAKRDLTRTTVLAPIPGIVTNVDALQVGEYLPAAQRGIQPGFVGRRLDRGQLRRSSISPT